MIPVDWSAGLYWPTCTDTCRSRAPVAALHVTGTLGVALIAQPELARTLESMNAEIREVAQRCEVVWLEPLDNELEAYLRHKFARFDLKYEDVFEKDAADAIRARLIHRPRGSSQVVSLCFPLAVHNLVCRAMNVAADVGWPKVDAQAVAGC